MEGKLMNFTIKNPSGINLVISMIIFILILISNLFKQDVKSLLLYINLLLILIVALGLTVAIIRTFKKQSKIPFFSKTIEVNGKLINAEEINIIMKYGIRKKIVGIKPKKNIIVPTDLCFQFINIEEGGIDYLNDWAKVNNIKCVK